MEVQFDFKGVPFGGLIKNYLLEQSRVVQQQPGERNFHIFYHLLAGGDAGLLASLRLSSSPADFHYTSQGGASKVATINDQTNFREVCSGDLVIGMIDWLIGRKILLLIFFFFKKNHPK